MLARLFPLVLIAAPPASASEASVYFAHEASGIGDPNPIFENGVYSVFYLKNEGRHPFWLTQSNDMADWSAPIEAIPVAGREAADYWTGSGSVIADPKGGYRLYYTGYHPDRRPREVVMEARAATLQGPWRKRPEMTFDGATDYDALDFRDPFVFWNPQAQAYWMLLATRKAGKAAIGLYSSADLSGWTARPPLYEENSPLNLEVPDLFAEGDAWYLLYSDQREQYRQVRYLRASTSPGPYKAPRWDALDGKAFYAGKSAGSGDDRLLFGWVAHKTKRDDRTEFDWGGDLVFHALQRRADGALAVDIPRPIADQFSNERTRLSGSRRQIGNALEALLVRTKFKVRRGDCFGVRFDGPGSKAWLRIDSRRGEASFRLAGGKGHVPHVAFPAPPDGIYSIDLVIDPALGLGVAYINRFRALSFRFYDVRKTSLSLFSDRPPVAIDGAAYVR